MPYAIPTAVHEPLLIHGDALDLLRLLPDESVDLSIADQPAGIGFMLRPWDSFKGYVPRTRRGREVEAQLGGGDLLARAAEALSSDADALASELLAASKARALLPPWALGFVLFCVDLWSEAFRVLKPGGFACVWALPKTADLAALALRAADFTVSDKPCRGWVEIHESVLHLFGGGMNKAGDIGKQIDKAAGAEREDIGPGINASAKSRHAAKRREDGQYAPTYLAAPEGPRLTAPATEAAKRWTGWHSQIAPGHEQWLIARKPSRLTYAQQLQTHGTGAFNVGATRIPRGEVQASGAPRRNHKAGEFLADKLDECASARDAHPSGSMPRNVVLSTGGDGCPAAGLDRQSGVMRDGVGMLGGDPRRARQLRARELADHGGDRVARGSGEGERPRADRRAARPAVTFGREESVRA